MFIHRLTFLNNSKSPPTKPSPAYWGGPLCFIIHALCCSLYSRCGTWITALSPPSRSLFSSLVLSPPLPLTLSLLTSHPLLIATASIFPFPSRSLRFPLSTPFISLLLTFSLPPSINLFLPATLYSYPFFLCSSASPYLIQSTSLLHPLSSSSSSSGVSCVSGLLMYQNPRSGSE